MDEWELEGWSIIGLYWSSMRGESSGWFRMKMRFRLALNLKGEKKPRERHAYSYCGFVLSKKSEAEPEKLETWGSDLGDKQRDGCIPFLDINSSWRGIRIRYNKHLQIQGRASMSLSF